MERGGVGDAISYADVVWALGWVIWCGVLGMCMCVVGG